MVKRVPCVERRDVRPVRLPKPPRRIWRAQVRRKGQHASRSLRLKWEAEAWANEAEDKVSRGKSAVGVESDASTTLAFIIDLHMRGLAEVGGGSSSSRWRRAMRLEEICQSNNLYPSS
ncbi:site specific integrase [Hyphomicrobium sp. 1Nfss2.1]